MKIIMKNKYTNYQTTLNKIELLTLDERRENICKSFAKKNINCDKIKHNFEENPKTHIMKTRISDHFEITFAHKQRLQNSPIIYMQKLLNLDKKMEGKVS